MNQITLNLIKNRTPPLAHSHAHHLLLHIHMHTTSCTFTGTPPPSAHSHAHHLLHIHMHTTSFCTFTCTPPPSAHSHAHHLLLHIHMHTTSFCTFTCTPPPSARHRYQKVLQKHLQNDGTLKGRVSKTEVEEAKKVQVDEKLKRMLKLDVQKRIMADRIKAKMPTDEKSALAQGRVPTKKDSSKAHKEKQPEYVISKQDLYNSVPACVFFSPRGRRLNETKGEGLILNEF